jgi:hypothetical protein
LVEAHVVHHAVAEGRGGAHFVADVALLAVEFLAGGAPALRARVVDLGALHLLVVLQPAGHHELVVAARLGPRGAVREHAHDGPLAALEQRRELLPRPGDGIEDAEPDEVALEGADFVHHEAARGAAQRQPADFLHGGEVRDGGERLPVALRGIEGVQLVRVPRAAILEQEQPRARVDLVDGLVAQHAPGVHLPVPSLAHEARVDERRERQVRQNPRHQLGLQVAPYLPIQRRSTQLLPLLVRNTSPRLKLEGNACQIRHVGPEQAPVAQLARRPGVAQSPRQNLPILYQSPHGANRSTATRLHKNQNQKLLPPSPSTPQTPTLTLALHSTTKILPAGATTKPRRNPNEMNQFNPLVHELAQPKTQKHRETAKSAKPQITASSPPKNSLPLQSHDSN